MSGTAGPPDNTVRRVIDLTLLGLALYLLALGALLRPAGGLLGRYATPDKDGREAIVHERVDDRLDFPVPQRIDAAYIFHWDYARLGFPSQMPPCHVRWSGLIRAPRAGGYGFALDAQGEVALSIDGVPVEIRPDALTERALASGWHPIEVDYRITSGEARLVLRWRPPGGSLIPVPSSALAAGPEAIAGGRSRRFQAWGLLLAGLAAAAYLAIRARRAGGAAARYAATLLAGRGRLALGAILLLAAALRFHDYALVPFHHETADEYQHAWEGWHLLHQGVPAAWSTFPDRYPVGQTVDFRWFGDRYVLVRPYFDHPPLFSVLVGLVTSLAGAADFTSCTLPVMRLVPIVLSLIGLLLLHALARAYGASERAALLAALVYATLPLIVMAHRLVKGESLLSLLFMGAILAAHRHDRTAKSADAILAGILCGLSLWTKATGVAVLATVVLMLAARRRYRAALIACGITAGFALLYLVYAWAYDFGIFLKVMEAQATTKWVSLDAFLDLLSGKVVTKFFGRGWYLWLMLGAACAGLRRERGLLVPLVLYGVVIALTADHRVIYGWYRIPIYPLLCVAAGVYLDELARAADLFHAAPFALTAVVTGLLYVLPAGLAKTQGAVALFAALALGPFLLRLVFERPWAERSARAATYLIILVFFAASVAAVGNLLEIYSATRGVQ